MKSKKLIDVGYLAFYGNSKAIKSFRIISNYARQVGVRLCLIEMTAKNIEHIRAKGNKSNIDVRIWNGKSIEEHCIQLPAIIYDRSPLNSQKNAELINQALIYVGCRFLNSLELRRLSSDKWMQYLFFSVRGIKVPNTNKFSFKILTKFLKKGKIFIKPRSGSLGKNQIIISSLESGGYKIFTTFGRKKNTLVNNYKELVGFLKDFELTRYIIQEAIDINQIEEQTSRGLRLRSYDFRVIVQRVSFKKVSIPLAYVRVGAIGSSQANISRGGHPQDPKSVFINHKVVVKKLEEEGKKIFFMLEEKYDISEIGLDFLCDKNGDYWLIEINSRPGTQGLRELRELVLSDIIKSNSRIIFDDNYSNKQRKKWGRSFNNFYLNPFRFSKEINAKKAEVSTTDNMDNVSNLRLIKNETDNGEVTKIPSPE